MRLMVKLPAAAHGVSETISATSLRVPPGSLTPAARDANRKPSGGAWLLAGVDVLTVAGVAVEMGLLMARSLAGRRGPSSHRIRTSGWRSGPPAPPRPSPDCRATQTRSPSPAPDRHPRRAAPGWSPAPGAVEPRPALRSG